MKAPSSAEEYLLKSQVMGYESHRAMFEAYSLNKYVSTGVIQWMLNNPWPEMIWHLYDFYLNQGGSYFGTKKGCEPVHIQYNYNTRGVSIVNSQYIPYPAASVTLRATADMYTTTAKLVFTRSVVIPSGGIPADGVLSEIITVPPYSDTGNTYFVHLTLQDNSGKVVSVNTYWLSTSSDVLDYSGSTFYNTPCTSFADFSDLMTLPKVTLTSSMKFTPNGTNSVATVSIGNPNLAVAFFIRLRIVRSSNSADVLPIIWADNMFSLFPQESREINAMFDLQLLNGDAPKLIVEIWNNIINP